MIILITLTFELVLDSHKSTFILILETVYFTALVVLNILMLCKYEYMTESKE